MKGHRLPIIFFSKQGVILLLFALTTQSLYAQSPERMTAPIGSSAPVEINPIQDSPFCGLRLNLNEGGRYTVEIKDKLGETLKTLNCSARTVILFRNDLMSGTYLAQVTNESTLEQFVCEVLLD